MHYDHISFHIDEHYPADLSPLNALHHMGFYYKWAVSQNLHSEDAGSLPEFAALQSGAMSGADFVQHQLGGGLDETCFNELGNRFTRYYYADDDDGYGFFLTDYFTTLGLQNDDDFYRTHNSPENQAALSSVFQSAFTNWYNSLK